MAADLALDRFPGCGRRLFGRYRMRERRQPLLPHVNRLASRRQCALNRIEPRPDARAHRPEHVLGGEPVK
jgi:hypothetical protein